MGMMENQERQRQSQNFVDSLMEANGALEKRINNLETNEAGSNYALIRDEKTSGTAGGTFTAGSWQTRTLNAEEVDSGNIASVASNQVTLQPGTYRFRGSGPAYKVNLHQVRLRNITAGTTIAVGVSATANAASTDVTRSEVTGRFTITVASVFELQHQSSTTRATDGFGLATGFGVEEVYSTLEFWKE